MPSKLQKAIGAVKDQTSISLAKVNNSSRLEVAVLKATKHDDIPIDERYVYEVLQLVSSNKHYAAACARAIGKRITRTRNWIVALKSLMLVLRIFQDGDPYFPREVLHAMKRGAKILNLSNFRDDSNSSPWDFTAYVRTFALYLDERLDCFLTGKLQRRYTHSERERSHSVQRRDNESIRDMKPSMLLDKILYWQRLLERAIATRPTGAAKVSRLVQISLYAVVRESFDLYKDISDGLVLLLDSFFHLQYQSCVSAFQICVKASKQFEELGAFYVLCRNIGIGRTSEYPSIQTISEELIETLQEFLKDQSSFPSYHRTPSKPLLLTGPGTGSPLRRNESYGGQSQFSDYTVSTEKYSGRTSEFGSQCTSLEDLISATETGRSPSISIDLEAYSDQFEKRSQRDEAFRVSDTGSTHSLPVMNSTIDLLSLDDWPQDEEQKEQWQEQGRKQDLFESILVKDSSRSSSSNGQLQSTSSNNLLQSGSGKGWELVLAESVSPLSQTVQNQANGHGALSGSQAQNGFDACSALKESGSREGWELILGENCTQPQSTHQTDIFSNTNSASITTPTQQQSTLETDIFSNTFDASTAITLYNEPQPTLSPTGHYNPFLQDLPVVTTDSSPSTMGFGASFPGESMMDPFPTEPTFQATTPSFAAQIQSDATNDPFQGRSPSFSAQNQSNGTDDPFQLTTLSFSAQNGSSRTNPSFYVQNQSNRTNDHFQSTTPSFSANNQSNGTNDPFATASDNTQNDPFASGYHKQDDPFASDMPSGDMYNGTVNQQNLLQQQQLWLQNQNKIMARHMANV